MDVVVINLDRMPGKLDEFERSNRGLVRYERFAAVDGLRASKQNLIAGGVLHPDLNYTDGAIGCALSHMTLWKRAVERNTPLTVCEDDAHFNNRFSRCADNAVAKLAGKFDLILWGWNFDSVLVFDLWGISSCAAAFNPKEMANNIERFKDINVTPTFYPLQRAYGLVCYTISPKGAAMLLRTILPLRPMDVFFPVLDKFMPNTGLDVVLSDLYPRIEALVSFPPMVLTKNERRRSTTLLRTPSL